MRATQSQICNLKPSWVRALSSRVSREDRQIILSAVEVSLTPANHGPVAGGRPRPARALPQHRRTPPEPLAREKVPVTLVPSEP